MMPAPDPASFRSEFPVFERLAYLNAGTEGPVPREAAEAAHRRIDLEATGGRCGHAYFEELLDLAARVRERYAGVLGCDPSEVALTGSRICQPGASGPQGEMNSELQIDRQRRERIFRQSPFGVFSVFRG